MAKTRRISDLTRKALWGWSGSRCAICKTALIKGSGNETDTVNIGKECHIFPYSENGPRGDGQYDGDINGYQNLILLCANHHDEIDRLPKQYSIDKLKELKTNHEKWVRDSLEKNKDAFSQGNHCLRILPRIKSGKQLVGLFNGISASILDDGPIENIEERKSVASLFDNLKDYTDIASDMSFSDIVDFEQDVQEELAHLSEMGIALFGIPRKFNSKDDGIIKTATVVAVKEDSPLIVKDTLIAMLSKSAYGN